MRLGDRAHVLAEDEGSAIWFAGALMVLKTGTDDSEGRFTLLDQWVGADYATPLHVHHAEDEAWYVLEGEMTFRFGDERFTAGPGSWVFLPRDVPHGFRAGPEGARLLTFAAPSGFDHFVREFGEPAQSATLPPPGPLDMQKLLQLTEKYRIEIVGPPEEI
jgi:quercetin dioxygenase-like cupin family protein